jgi:hypothetical protein
MSSVVKSITGAAKSIVGSAGDLVGDVVDFGEDFIDEAGKVVSDLDIEDAVTTYVMTGGNPYAAAFAATDLDEDLGFNPAAFYDPSAGTFGFADPNVYGGGMPGVDAYPGQSIIEPFATQALTGLARSALEQDQSTQQQMAGLANLTLDQLSDLQSKIESGVFEQTPSQDFFASAPINSNILGRYDQAKANLSNIIRPPGILGMDERLGIYENYFQERGLI